MENIKRKAIGFLSFKLIIPLFVILMFIGLKLYGLSSMEYVILTLKRVGMLMIMMLAVTPTIHSGVGINYGVTIGFVCGLAGAILGILTGLTGILLMLACILFSIPFAAVTGYGYGILLNKAKGTEELISTYTGFAFVSMGSMFWVMINTSNNTLRFTNGSGIRIQVGLEGLFKDILTNFLPVNIGNFTIPFGFMLVCIVICLCFSAFMHSTIGIKIQICGYNPNYARSIGLNVDRYRTLSVMISTAIAAIGICFYAQTYGFYEFYSAYLTMGFTCVAGVLIGGASEKRVTIINVIYGCIMYEAIMTVSTPLVNKMITTGALPEIIRVLITNGVILYALTKGGKKTYE
jgi:simple sugar transport system permease protein